MRLIDNEKNYWLLKVTMLLIIMVVDSCVHEPFVHPAATNQESQNSSATSVSTNCAYDGTVCFESHVLPIFISSCAKSGCHDASSKVERYNLSNYASIVSRGISPGNANGSKLYKVLFGTGEKRMPPDAPLSQAQKDSIALWINQGAKNTTNCNCGCDASLFSYKAIIQPLLSSSCVGCHKPGTLGGNVDLSTYSSVKTEVSNGRLLGTVQHKVGYSPMPQGGKLADCQIEQIKNWIDAGAANN